MEKILKIIMMLSLISMMIGCSNSDLIKDKNKSEEIKTIQNFESKKNVVYIKEQCSDFPLLDENKNYNIQDLVEYITIDVYNKYIDCKNKNSSNIKILERITK